MSLGLPSRIRRRYKALTQGLLHCVLLNCWVGYSYRLLSVDLQLQKALGVLRSSAKLLGSMQVQCKLLRHLATWF